VSRVKRAASPVDKASGVASEVSQRDVRDPAGDRPTAFSSVASKIILLVFAGTFVTATLVSWVSIQSAGASLRHMIERLHPLSLDHAATRLEPWIQGIRLQLEVEAYRRDHDGPEPSAETRAVLDGLAIYDAAGGLIERFGVAPAQARAALDAEQGIAAIELAPDEYGLAIAPRRESGPRRLVGVVSLSRLVPMFAHELPSDATLIALVDGEGRVLVHAGTPPGNGPIEHLSLEALHSRGSLRETELGGAHVIGAAQPIALLDWHVAIVTPFEDAYGAVLKVVTRIFLIDLGIILAFSFLAYRVAARVMRPIANLSDAVRRFAEGGSDFEIPDVHTRDEIAVLTSTFNDMMRRQRGQREQIEEANRHLKDRNSRLEQANEVLNQLSITDGLTKLHNHRFFQDHLTREIRRVERTQEPLAVLLLDIDDFKRINDRLGHAAGDEILTRIAQILNSTVRGSDLCARYGGEEFVVLAPNTAVEGAYQLAEKLRTEIAESSFIVDDSLRPLRVTVSLGVAIFRGNRKRFFQKADQALYRAKADGKNCVVIHDDDLLEEEAAG